MLFIISKIVQELDFVILQKMYYFFDVRICLDIISFFFRIIKTKSYEIQDKNIYKDFRILSIFLIINSLN